MRTVPTTGCLLAFRGEVEMSSMAEVRPTTSTSYIRLQAGLMRENVLLPDGVELGASVAPAGANSDQTSLLAFIRDAADSFVSRRVSTSSAGQCRHGELRVSTVCWIVAVFPTFS